MKRIALGAALASAVAYLADARRRHVLRDKLLKLFRRGGRTAGGVAAQASGLAQKATHLREQPKDYDDVTLTRKVETELFRDADAPKGTVDVNVQNGVVQLRGQVERPDLIEDLVSKARSIQGVQDVENLLHTPGEPAPMHQ